MTQLSSSRGHFESTDGRCNSRGMRSLALTANSLASTFHVRSRLSNSNLYSQSLGGPLRVLLRCGRSLEGELRFPKRHSRSSGASKSQRQCKCHMVRSDLSRLFSAAPHSLTTLIPRKRCLSAPPILLNLLVDRFGARRLIIALVRWTASSTPSCTCALGPIRALGVATLRESNLTLGPLPQILASAPGGSSRPASLICRAEPG